MASGKTRCWYKEGVVHQNFKKKILEAKQIVYDIYGGYGLDLFITSGEEGNHGCGSLHYVGKAIDIDLPPANLLDFIHRDIASALGGKGYDVVLHNTSHFHIEFDPKPGEPGYESH